MTVPSFAVQEFQVIGTNVDAQYGRTSTGAITYVFKSGSNAMHGSLFEYNRNTDYDAKNYFETKRDVVDQNEFGGEAGGEGEGDLLDEAAGVDEDEGGAVGEGVLGEAVEDLFPHGVGGD